MNILGCIPVAFFFFFKQKQEVGPDFASGTQLATLDLIARTKILPVM